MSSQSLHSRADLFEAEILDGLKPIASKELQQLLGQHGELFDEESPDRIAFSFSKDPRALWASRTVVAIFRLLYFKVTGPVAILNDSNAGRMIDCILEVKRLNRFTSFRVNAAGSDSSVFKKIKALIAKRTGLTCVESEGEMSLRFRRSKLKRFGWDVLIRLTPKPLSARSWRVENMPGALNATIAAALCMALEPAEEDIFLNLMCGSGTCMREWSDISGKPTIIGIDLSAEALRQSRANLGAFASGSELIQGDASTLPLKTRSVSKICCDLPWGRLIGKGTRLDTLYAHTLREAARVCRAKGKFAVITQETEIFDKALSNVKNLWRFREAMRVKQSDYRPKIYILERISS